MRVQITKSLYAIRLFNAIHIRNQTKDNLIKRTNRAIKSLLLFTSLLAQLALLMQRVPRCMNVSWPPCCLLPFAQIQPFSLLPEEARTPLSIALTYTLLPSSSAISWGGGVGGGGT